MTEWQKHPIEPSPELVKQWLGEYFGTSVTGEISDVEHFLATKAARWGANQELEECCKLAENDKCCGTAFQRRNLVRNLKERRRPRPLSLKVQALLAIDVAVADNRLSADVANIVRRALGECK